MLWSRDDPRVGGPAPRADACILLFLLGGPSHIDIWDMKPLAPAEIRGEFRPIATSQPGVEVCEHLPRLARQMHRFAQVRAVHHADSNHDTAAYTALTGHERGGPPAGPSANDYPGPGSVVPLLRPAVAGAVPSVWMPHRVGIPGELGGFLGRARDPLVLEEDPSDGEFDVPWLSPGPGVDARRLGDRRRLLGALDGAGIRPGARVGGRQSDLLAFRERALDLVATPAIRRAFRIEEEPDGLRRAYGLASTCGQSLLLARRLVEAGTRYVGVVADRVTGGRWDTHKNGFATLRTSLLPELDAALSALVADLAGRGLLERTLVAVLGEFGRAPRVSPGGGREHWASCYTALLAGGGTKGGYIHGASDRMGAHPARDPATPGDLIATIYRCLGIRHDLELHDVLGRPMRLVPGGGPIDAVLS